MADAITEVAHEATENLGCREGKSPLESEAIIAVRKSFNHLEYKNWKDSEGKFRTGVGIASELTEDQSAALSLYREAWALKHLTHGDKFDLNDTELAALHSLRDAVTPIAESDDEKEWVLDNFNLMRFLRSRDFDVGSAKTSVQTTLERRRQLNPYRMSCPGCLDDPHCGDLRFVGYDRLHRPVCYSSFKRSKNRTPEKTVVHTTCMLEKARHMLHHGCPPQLLWITSFAQFGFYDLNPRFALDATRLFTFHYPEMLGLFLCIDAPRMFSSVWKVCKPLLHERTAAKIHFLDAHTDPTAARKLLLQWFDEDLTDHLLTEFSVDY
uniref:CRAL-TRIO domain-containing protein n=1 Tax=Cyanoptyche gloeocystis TaxID=77922 RepID=A0A7S2JNA4_9EUKA